MSRRARGLAVVAAMVVAAVAVLVFGFGGGGKAEKSASAPEAASSVEAQTSDADANASTTDVDAQSQDDASASAADAAQSQADAAASTDAGSGETSSSTTEGDSYDEQLEELLEQVDAQSAPVGANARDAAQEQGVPSVAELSAQLASRGFPTMDIIAPFDMAGTYQGDAVLDPDATQRYPSYQMTYQSEQGVQWVVVVNAQHYLAVPLGVNGTALQRQIILAESDVVVQYDGTKAQYSDFGFDELEDAVGVKVPRIDKATLDSYTAQKLREI